MLANVFKARYRCLLVQKLLRTEEPVIVTSLMIANDADKSKRHTGLMINYDSDDSEADPTQVTVTIDHVLTQLISVLRSPALSLSLSLSHTHTHTHMLLLEF